MQRAQGRLVRLKSDLPVGVTTTVFAKFTAWADAILWGM
jgi:hypothetical protein